MSDLYTTLESNVVYALTDKYPSEFENDEDRDYWLDKAGKAISELREHFAYLISQAC